MESYIDIQILPNPEIAAPVVMNGLFYRLHLRLAASGLQVGVSFPQYRMGDEASAGSLGSLLRLHGQRDDLAKLDVQTTMGEFCDYTFVGEISDVPGAVSEYASFVRKHCKSMRDVDRKRRYLLKKANGEWNDVAQESLRRFMEKLHCALPFVHLASHSSKPAEGETQNSFHLFIAKEAGPRRNGSVTRYGLSDPQNKMSMPIF